MKLSLPVAVMIRERAKLLSLSGAEHVAFRAFPLMFSSRKLFALVGKFFLVSYCLL